MAVFIGEGGLCVSVTRKVYGGKRNVAEKTSSSTLAEKRQVGARVGGDKRRWRGMGNERVSPKFGPPETTTIPERSYPGNGSLYRRSYENTMLINPIPYNREATALTL